MEGKRKGKRREGKVFRGQGTETVKEEDGLKSVGQASREAYRTRNVRRV